MSSLPPLSISILGVEPLDEFIKEIADFIHHMILTRPADKLGTVEVEAKLGLLKDRAGQRIKLPVHVETSVYSLAIRALLIDDVVLTHEVECRFESNMTPVSLSILMTNPHRHLEPTQTLQHDAQRSEQSLALDRDSNRLQPQVFGRHFLSCLRKSSQQGQDPRYTRRKVGQRHRMHEENQTGRFEHQQSQTSCRLASQCQSRSPSPTSRWNLYPYKKKRQD